MTFKERVAKLQEFYKTLDPDDIVYHAVRASRDLKKVKAAFRRGDATNEDIQKARANFNALEGLKRQLEQNGGY